MFAGSACLIRLVGPFLIAGSCVASVCHSALAQQPPLDLTVEAWNEAAYGFFQIDADDWQWDEACQCYFYQQNEPAMLYDKDTGDLVGILYPPSSVHLTLGPTRTIDISMILIAGGGGTTTFVVQTPTLETGHVAEQDAEARASATFTVDDLDENYVLLTGVGTQGTGAFRGYTYDGAVQERFTHLIGFIFASNGGEATASQNDPPSGFRAVGSPVDALSVELAFSLTPNDLAQATCRLEVPVPSICPTDLNDDGRTDLVDLSITLDSFGLCQGDSEFADEADIDGDSCVSLGDLVIVLSAFGSNCD